MFLLTIQKDSRRLWPKFKIGPSERGWVTFRVAILAFFKPNFTILAFFNSLWLGKFEFGFFLKFGLFLAFLKFVFSFQKFHCLGVYGRK